MKQNFFTSLGMNNINPNLISKTVRFLLENKYHIIIDDPVIDKMVNNLPSISKNPLNDLFQFVKENLHSTFKFVKITGLSDIPTLLLLKHVIFDVKSLDGYFDSGYRLLNNDSDYRDKIIINLTPILNKKADKILDLNTFHSFIARGIFSRSYNNFSKTWIGYPVIEKLTKFYSIPLASNITRLYNLDIKEMYNIAILFSYFFVIRMCDFNDINKDIETAKNIVQSYTFLGNKGETSDTISLIESIIEEKFETNSPGNIENLRQMFDILIEITPKRLYNLTFGGFLTICRTFNYDNWVSLISLDFPPYWLYNLFAVASGEKNNLFFTLTKNNLLKDAIQFIISLLHNKKFIDSF